MASEDDVHRNMVTWGLPPSMFAQALEYTNKLAQQKYYAKNFLFEYQMGDQPGIVCACSTKESNRQYQHDVQLNARGGMITKPEFFFYEVWYFVGLALFNFAGMTDPEYDGQKVEQSLEGILDGAFRVKGNAHWRREYCHLDAGGEYEAVLRRVLHEGLGIPILLEIVCGISMWGYNCLDAYVKVLTQGMPSPTQEAWYILNSEFGKDARPTDPEDWYGCRHWLSKGQRGSISCTTLIDIRYQIASIVASPLGRESGMVAAHRATRILGHCAGFLPTSIPASLIPRDIRNKGKGQGKAQGKGQKALGSM